MNEIFKVDGIITLTCSHLYIIDGVCLFVCLSVTNSQDRPEGPLCGPMIGPKGLCGDRRALRCQPKAGNSACAGRRPAYMLVYITIIVGQM